MTLVDKKYVLKKIDEEIGIYFVAPKDFPDFSEKFSEKIQEVAYKIGESDTGAMLVDGEKKILLIPPFPIERSFEGGKKELEELLEKDYTIGVILLRLGEYSLGIFDEGELKNHKTGTQFVSGQTKAGGQSAARYGRIRDGQINDFFKKVCSKTTEKFSQYENKIDFVFFGGDREVKKAFIESCDYIRKFRVLDRVLNVRHMKLESLKNSRKEIMKFKLYEIQ